MKVSAANSVRTHYAAHAAVLVLAFAICSVGCRSRSERDLVERELRMHEDQVYALEDYVTEYQEIVRRIRCENMELRRQLEQLQTAGTGATEKSTDSSTLPPPDDSWSPDRPRTKSLLDRRSQPKPDPFKDEQPAADPGITSPMPPVDAEEPDIELGAPMPVTPPAAPPSAAPPATPPMSQGTAIPPVYFEPEAPDVVPAGVLSDARPLAQSTGSDTKVHGDWVWLEGHEGPSLHIQVVPQSANGSPLDYEGPLEVLLLDPADGPTAPALARWEFTPAEVEAAWRDPQARAELDVLAAVPAELPLDRPLELWARLRPSAGGKLLASTLLGPCEEPSETLSDTGEPLDAIDDDNVTQANHWVPSESPIAPKAAGDSGWMPRKP